MRVWPRWLFPIALGLAFALPPLPGAGAQAKRQFVQIAQTETGPSGRPLPRFVSLRAPEVNLRSGPGIRYPIEWVYTLKGMPLEVIDEFDTWRRVRDWQGSTGWVHQSMLSPRRGALVIGRQRLMRRQPEEGAPGVALVEAGVVGELRGCTGGWCRIDIKGFAGWFREKEIFGVLPGERVE
ncbi:MAG: SH3 domain-containing protein [Kiloniellales bacterium]